MAQAPFIYHGNKAVDTKIYEEELKSCHTYEQYQEVKKKYKHYFVNSRPYAKTITATGHSRFPMEWNRTLKTLKTLFNYTPPPRKSANLWGELLREQGE